MTQVESRKELYNRRCVFDECERLARGGLQILIGRDSQAVVHGREQFLGETGRFAGAPAW